eukprot:4888532-Amphidinium_carterae.2
MELAFVRLIQKCGQDTQSIVCTVTGEEAELPEGVWSLSADANGVPFVHRGAQSTWVLDVLHAVPRRNDNVLELVKPDNSVRLRGQRGFQSSLSVTALRASQRSLEDFLCDYRALSLPVVVAGSAEALQVACYCLRQGFHGSTGYVDIRSLRAAVFHSDNQSASAWVQHSLMQWRARVEKSGLSGQQHVRRERNRLARDHTSELFFGSSLKVFDSPVVSCFALIFLLQTWCQPGVHKQGESVLAWQAFRAGLLNRVFGDRHFTFTIADDPKKVSLVDGIIVGGASELMLYSACEWCKHNGLEEGSWNCSHLHVSGSVFSVSLGLVDFVCS